MIDYLIPLEHLVAYQYIIEIMGAWSFPCLQLVEFNRSLVLSHTFEKMSCNIGTKQINFTFCYFHSGFQNLIWCALSPSIIPCVISSHKFHSHFHVEGKLLYYILRWLLMGSRIHCVGFVNRCYHCAQQTITNLFNLYIIDGMKSVTLSWNR